MSGKKLFVLGLVLLIAVCAVAGVQPAVADPEVGQSASVVIIGGSTLDTTCAGSVAANVMTFTGGGCLPVVGAAGELGDFAFAPMMPADVNAANLASFDTAVLNVASSAMACDTDTLSASQKADLVAFAASGKKLIIYDSECSSAVDYSWLPFPFTTSNPGAMGAQGTLTIVEENKLSSSVTTDAHYIDAAHLGSYTDAVGDMNVMTTFDANWCLDMSGTNVLGTTGPVHTYAKYPAGTDVGLFVYNGLDQDYQYGWMNDPELRKIWVQELQQPFNPSNLPCGFTVVGITLTPEIATGETGTDHTVTATLSDLLGTPQPGVLVTFAVLSGPNAGTSGMCSPNADCTTDAAGQVAFTYPGDGGEGTDEIQACFVDSQGNTICSQIATMEWTPPPVIFVPFDIHPISCPNPINTDAGGATPVAILGTADFDVTQVDPATVQLEGVAPLRWALADVATPYEPYTGKEEAYDCTTAGPDGYMDLTVKFKTQELVAALGMVYDGDVLVLQLSGYLLPEFGGTEIAGEDVIIVLSK